MSAAHHARLALLPTGGDGLFDVIRLTDREYVGAIGASGDDEWAVYTTNENGTVSAARIATHRSLRDAVAELEVHENAGRAGA